jgi:acyl-coenzyme A thioesterase PaaI-like protein
VPAEDGSTTRLDAAEITEFLTQVFPGAMERFAIEEVQPMRSRVRMRFSEFQLRPGGTISGPSLMTLADTGLWVALLAMIGREPLSVTSHLDIDFLRKPAAADVIAHTVLHKVGKRLAVGDVIMYSDGESVPCARASVTYAIPSHRLDPPANSEDVE